MDLTNMADSSDGGGQWPSVRATYSKRRLLPASTTSTTPTLFLREMSILLSASSFRVVSLASTAQKLVQNETVEAKPQQHPRLLPYTRGAACNVLLLLLSACGSLHLKTVQTVTQKKSDVS